MKNCVIVIVLFNMIFITCTPKGENMEASERNSLKIGLNFVGNEINVNAEVIFNKPLNELSFILDNSLVIEKNENDNHPVHWGKPAN